MVSFVQKIGFVVGKRGATHIDRAACTATLKSVYGKVSIDPGAGDSVRNRQRQYLGFE
jgi:hypothetical protein